MEILLSKILSHIRLQEDKLSSQMVGTADEAYQMTLFLKERLLTGLSSTSHHTCP